MSKVISKDNIQDFLTALMAKFTVVAPMPRHEAAPAEFRELEPGDQPILDGSGTMMPPKDYFLPRYEVLVKVEQSKDGVKLESPIPESKPRVMLGAWLPDLQGIQVLDRVFLDKKFTDPYYAARRESTILVAIMPARPRWSWFCASLDDVEGWKKNVDAVMYDLGDRFYVEVISDKGERVVEGSFFADPTDADTPRQKASGRASRHPPACRYRTRSSTRISRGRTRSGARSPRSASLAACAATCARAARASISRTRPAGTASSATAAGTRASSRNSR